MSYVEHTPEELLSMGFAAVEVVEKRWCVHWEETRVDPALLVRETLPSTVDFQTSGSTGASQTWRRTRDTLWLEAGMLAELVATEKPEAIVSFVPPAHLFGALASVLVPAHLRLPVWYRSTYFGAMPAIEQRRAVVVATPWIFTLLLEHMEWVHALDHLAVLYGGAMLPATAREFLSQAGSERAEIVELLGSTEAGGIGTRRWRHGEPPPWTLFDDVSFAEGMEPGGEGRLVVRSPRLAFRPGEKQPRRWEADDHVEMLDGRTFRFAGRRTRLVKINGRRVNLDEEEHAMRAVLDCADLALLPVEDRMIGEHVDLLLVLKKGTTLGTLDLPAAIDLLGVRPRRVHVVPLIDRSQTGKLRRIQTALPTHTEEEP